MAVICGETSASQPPGPRPLRSLLPPPYAPPLSPGCLQEKNWGGGFPRRWCWVQCNTFEGEPGTSVTAVGALRGLLGVPGVEENVGMIGIHHRGRCGRGVGGSMSEWLGRVA